VPGDRLDALSSKVFRESRGCDLESFLGELLPCIFQTFPEVKIVTPGQFFGIKGDLPCKERLLSIKIISPIALPSPIFFFVFVISFVKLAYSLLEIKLNSVCEKLSRTINFSSRLLIF
jgi:hypothetical protein